MKLIDSQDWNLEKGKKNSFGMKGVHLCEQVLIRNDHSSDFAVKAKIKGRDGRFLDPGRQDEYILKSGDSVEVVLPSNAPNGAEVHGDFQFFGDF